MGQARTPPAIEANFMLCAVPQQTEPNTKRIRKRKGATGLVQLLGVVEVSFLDIATPFLVRCVVLD